MNVMQFVYPSIFYEPYILFSEEGDSLLQEDSPINWLRELNFPTKLLMVS